MNELRGMCSGSQPLNARYLIKSITAWNPQTYCTCSTKRKLCAYLEKLYYFSSVEILNTVVHNT